MNTKLRKEAKNDFEKDFFKLINNSVFGKTVENVRKHRDIKLVTTDEKKKQISLSTKLSHSKTLFKKFVSNRNEKNTKVKINKPIYLGMSILDISKTLMYKFWCGYFKPKYGDRAKLCYTDTDSFIVTNDVKVWHDRSNYDENDKRPLPIGKNKKVIGLFKDELGGRILKQFCALRAKTYPYLIDHNSEVKKSKGTKKCVIKLYRLFV